MKNHYTTRNSELPWLLTSIGDDGMQIIHARFAKRQVAQKSLVAYCRLYPSKDFKLKYEPKI